MAATTRSATTQPAPVEIVRFRPRHLARILHIERAAFPEEPYTRAIFRNLYSECGELFLIAKLARRIAGYIATCAGDGRAEVISLAVDPEHRKKGIAAALLEHTLERLRESGVRSVELMVRVDNQEAIRFYRRFGFRRIQEVPGYYENGRAGLRMRRR
ncbi:MAG: ribosomal protein S18-alanine N-acetyltransferase [Bryobacteraceae bacterium]|jgi:ribosomal-protein-alanine N-acetyltransferase